MEQYGLVCWACGYAKQVRRLPDVGPNVLIDSSVSFGSDVQVLLPEEYELDDAQHDGPEIDSFLPKIFALDTQRVSAHPGGLPPFHPTHQRIDPHMINLIPNAVQPCDPYMIPHTSQPNSSSQIDFQPYDPHLLLEYWTNNALLSMLQNWQDVICSGEEQYALEHPNFQ